MHTAKRLDKQFRQGELKALLLAGGLGTRLKPFTDSRPKCLAPIGGKPILGHWIEKLEVEGCKEVIVNTHHLSKQVQSYIETLSDKTIKITLSHEEKLLGTAGTFKKHTEFFRGSTGLLIHVDNAMFTSLSDFLMCHSNRPCDCIATMVTFKTLHPTRCGIVELDTAGKMVNFHEKVNKPPGNIANGAIYAFGDEFLEFTNSLNEGLYDLSKDVISKMKGKMYTWFCQSPFIDIGTPESLAKAQLLWNNSENR